MADGYNLDAIHFQLQDMLRRGHVAGAQDFYRNMLAKGIPVTWPVEFGPAPDLASIPPEEVTPRTPEYGFPAPPPPPPPVVAAPAPADPPVPAVYTPPTPPPPPPSTFRPDPAAPAAPKDDPAQRNALEYTRSLFPWLDQLGIMTNLQEWVVQGLGPEALVAEVRRTPQYEAIFQGIRRPDGSLRKSEAQFLQDNQAYRQVLRSFARPDYEYDRPEDLRAFHEMDMRPDELEQRFQVYDQVTRGGSDMRDAFYVYAGMRLSDDDLYQMAVNPTFRDAKQREYGVRSTITPPDFETWIARATEVGLERAAQTLTDLQKSGVSSADAMSTLQATNPEQARALADALARADDNGTPRVLALNELVHSLQYALIGSAATFQGLELPDAQRIEAIRRAGVDRARALEGYAQIARQGNSLRGALQRANLSPTFSQEEFEKALFLSSGREVDLLQRAQASEAALGRSTGGPAFSAGPAGGLQQRGLRPF